ncbi:unnamed protein product, partial [Meganyctiphanes norvegica]
MSKVVLVLGSGGREHALAKSLMGSSSKVVVAPGNAGTATTKGVTNLQLNIKDQQEVSSWCKNNNVNVVVVGPEDPLAEGLADHLQTQGIKVFGPCKAAAQIESSKAWAKDFMKRHEIPTADYSTFHSAEEAKKFINSKSSWSGWVVKASGLAAGKGVVVATTTETALAAVDTVAGSFGAAGDTIVVEEMLTGEEVSVLCFSDGESIAVMPPAQDHKRLEEGDKGPNTGGMGAYCPCPLISQSDIQNVTTNILQKTILGLKQEGNPFVGVLYAGLMLTPSGPSVLEFNCRFGDPETQVILPLLQTPLLDIVMACVEGRLSQTSVEFNKSLSCVAVCLVSGGYPGSYPKGKIITGLDEASNIPHVSIYHAGTKLEGENIVTSGGRVLAVTVTDETLSSAAAKATSVSSSITFEGVFYRKDISAKARLSRECRLTYASSGVDIVAGDALVAAIKGAASATNRSGVLGDLGSFGGVFDVKAAGFKDPLLISGTDGVGTKLKVVAVTDIKATVKKEARTLCLGAAVATSPSIKLSKFVCRKSKLQNQLEDATALQSACVQSRCSTINEHLADMPHVYTSCNEELDKLPPGIWNSNMQRLIHGHDAGLKANISKCKFYQNQVKFLGKIVDRDGINMSYIGRHVPGLREARAPLDALLTPETKYSWGPVQDKAFNSCKILADASPHGLGACLSHKVAIDGKMRLQPVATTWVVVHAFIWILSFSVSSDQGAAYPAGDVTSVTALPEMKKIGVYLQEDQLMAEIKSLAVNPVDVATKTREDKLYDGVVYFGSRVVIPTCQQASGRMTPQLRRLWLYFSDNGPQLHLVIPPYHAASNGLAERAVGIIYLQSASYLQRNFNEDDNVIVYDSFKKINFSGIVKEVLGNNNYLVEVNGLIKHISGDSIAQWIG